MKLTVTQLCLAVVLVISGNFYLWSYQNLDLPLASVLLLVGGIMRVVDVRRQL